MNSRDGKKIGIAFLFAIIAFVISLILGVAFSIVLLGIIYYEFVAKGRRSKRRRVPNRRKKYQ